MRMPDPDLFRWWYQPPGKCMVDGCDRPIWHSQKIACDYHGKTQNCKAGLISGNDTVSDDNPEPPIAA